MMTNEILEEKQRVQRQLSKNAKNIHDYFLKAHQAAKDLTHKYGKTKYETNITPHHMASEKQAEYNAKKQKDC